MLGRNGTRERRTVGYSQHGFRHQSVNLEKLTDPTTARPGVTVLNYL